MKRRRIDYFLLPAYEIESSEVEELRRVCDEINKEAKVEEVD
jgi:hypothetical protein